MKSFTFKTLESTASKAFELLKRNEKTPFSVHTQTQTEGRGTGNKSWLSPKGGLYLQVVFPYSPEALLPQKIGILVAKWLDENFQFRVTLKWPNDLTFSGRKLGGILCEIHCVSQKSYLSIGIGLNLRKIQNNNGLNVKAISLEEICSLTFDLDSHRRSLVSYFNHYFIQDSIKLSDHDFELYFMPEKTFWHPKENLRTLFTYDSLTENGTLLLKSHRGQKYLTSGESPFTWYFLDNSFYPKPVGILRPEQDRIKLILYKDFRDQEPQEKLDFKERISSQTLKSFLKNDQKELPLLYYEEEKENLEPALEALRFQTEIYLCPVKHKKTQSGNYLSEEERKAYDLREIKAMGSRWTL